MKKGYICPSVCIVKIQGGDLLEGFKASGTKVIIPTNGNINKGNATMAASKYNYNLWDYDDEDFEDFEDKEDDKKKK